MLEAKNLNYFGFQKLAQKPDEMNIFHLSIRKISRVTNGSHKHLMCIDLYEEIPFFHSLTRQESKVEQNIVLPPWGFEQLLYKQHQRLNELLLLLDERENDRSL